MNMVYVVLTIEYERGWGSKPDGYLAFLSKKSADDFIKTQTKDRNGPAPDYYVNYEHVGEKPCSLDFQLAVMASKYGFLYADTCEELLWSTERRKSKYRT